MIASGPQILTWESKLQIQSIGLRHEVLRRPLGMLFSPAELQEEIDQIHMGWVHGETVEAILLLKKTTPNQVKMRQVAVHPSLQGKGLGKKLVAFTEEWCKKNNISSIELNARETAIPFYLSMNYHAVGEPFTEVGIPHIKMVKSL